MPATAERGWHRSTVLVRYYDGRSTDEMAASMDISPAAVRKRLSRAHEMLRARLDQRHDWDRRAWALAFVSWLEGRDPTLAVAGKAAVLTGGIAMGVQLKWLVAVSVLGVVGTYVWWERPEFLFRPSAS